MAHGRGPDARRADVVWRAVLVAAAVVPVVAVVACRPIPLGGASNQIGNDPSSCPQYQPSPSCGPQPMVWGSIQAPYQTFADGDPYTTKCGRNLTVSVAACSSGPYPGGATNSLYDPTGYEYAIDVGPEDVGVPLTLEVYDAGSYQRTAGGPTIKNVVVATTVGSDLLVRSSGSSFAATDVGKPISGAGIPPGATVATYVSTTRVTISAPADATATGVSVAVVVSTPDCLSSQAPFTTSPYFGTVQTQNCQTGDQGSSPIQMQLFDDDGDDEAVGYESPIPTCHLYVAPGAEAATYKNAWAPVCSFTPTRAGIHPLRVKSSSIVLPDGTPVTDTGTGYNQFALRVDGGDDTRLYALDVLSIFTNTPSGSARFYLAEITTADAGKRLQIDLFDPGDGNSGTYVIQVLAPPSGAPGVVPGAGTVIPAAGYADSCRYNSTPSSTRGPDVAAPRGNVANNCQVVTRFASSSTSVYNNSWLSIEIDIAADYVCDTDCWWTVRYDFGGAGGVPTDRTVWSPLLFDRPAPPQTTTSTAPETTTTLESTTTTLESTTTTTESTTTTTSTTIPIPLGSPRTGPDLQPPSA